MRSSISAAILAGGANKRFGGIIKAKLNVGGRPIIARMLETIGEIFDEILIVTNTPEEFQDYCMHSLVSDLIKNIGPLGGIHAALKSVSGEAVFVFAGDMPFPDADIITKMIEQYSKTRCQIIVPQVNKYIEPLLGIYSVSVLPELENFISEEGNYAIHCFLNRMDVCYIELENRPETFTALTNINKPADLKQLNTWGSEK
jgi:molybdopterin-guanine dinucleotide biosynthesis protein A